MNFKGFAIKTFFGIFGATFLIIGILAGIAIIRTRQNLTNYAAVATNLYFSPQKQRIYTNNDFAFSLKMDTGVNDVTGLDIGLIYNPEIFEIQSIARGEGISTLDQEITNTIDNTLGTINYIVFTLDKSQSVKGTGIEILKVFGKVKSTAPEGEYEIVYDSTSAISARSESHNALSGFSNGTITVIKPSPTDNPGNPNSCGGTCGSNYNCQSNYMCYQGFCRNPNCPNEVSCGCNSATPQPTQPPTPKPTEQPIIETYIEPIEETPYPTSNYWQSVSDPSEPTDPSTEFVTPEIVSEPESKSITPWIIGAFIVAGITLILASAGLYKYTGFHKNKPPVIKL